MRITKEDAKRLGLDFDALWRSASPVPALSSPHLLAANPSPSLVGLEVGPGWWLARISDWNPTSDNVRARSVRAWYRGKVRDREVLREMLVGRASIPLASGRRKVTLLVTKRSGRGIKDAANMLKSLHDACKTCGLIVDDDETWLDWDRPRIVIDRELGYRVMSTITLEEQA